MARDANGNWINSKNIPWRERQDRYLESRGLLNYQTKGMSTAEIAQRYANAGVRLNENSQWFRQNYGQDMPQGGGLNPPQLPINFNPQPPTGAGGIPVIPRVRDLRGPKTFPAPALSPDERDERINYVQDAKSGLVVKEIKPQFSTVWLEDPNPPDVDAQFASLQDALNGQAGWGDVSVAERQKLLSDPTFYQSGRISKMPMYLQQEILADPNFEWDQLPKWQQKYFEFSSSPARMGAVQGATLGLGTGGLWGSAIGAAIGGGLGYVAGASGYDPTKEWNEQTNKVSAGFGLLNWLAEQAEKTIGMGAQMAQAAVDPTKAVVDVLNRESWDAGATFFEVMTPAFIDAMNKGKGELGWDDLLKVSPPVYVLARIGDILIRPEKYKGEELFLGAESPIQLDETWIERIDAAREEIKAGRPYREVMMEMQAGIVAQLGDMAGQATADPLNVLPNMTTRVGAKIADVSGNKVAATALRQSPGLMEAGRKYKTLVQSGQSLIIDPNFKVDQMGRVSRFIAGINDQGEVRAGSLVPTQAGLLAPIKNKTGFIEDMASQNPYSRAQTGAQMFYENVSALMQMFDDPHEAGKYLKALANSDMETWAELGTRFAESPEFYTVLPALKEFNMAALDGIIQAWDITAPNRDLLTRMADVLGEQPAKVLEDLARKGTAEQDYQRIIRRLQEKSSPEAQALLKDAADGRFTPETLKQMVDVFTGDGALAWHPGQWKANMLDSLGTHFDKWVTQRLMLDKSPEAVSAFFRTTALLKQAQSILLLGGSPGYAITNGLSNMVHRAVTGVYGYLTPGQINKFMERFGVTPARFEEGVGIGGVVEQAASRSKVQMDAMSEAVKGKGALTTAKNALGKIGRAMPFNKVSSWFEKTEGRQAFVIGMKQFWNQSWRRGVGFREMSPDLVRVIRDMGQDPNRFYAAIEAGMNQGEIEAALMGRRTEVQARALINDAAQKTGMTASAAADMLDKVGVLDTLDTYLKGQTTDDAIRAAFRRAERVAQDYMDMQTGEDLKAIAESVKQRVGLEGAASGLDVIQKAHGIYTDAWMDHYYRFGEVMNDLTLLDDPNQRNKAIDYQYEVSDAEFRRVNARNAANYTGIFEAWGLSGNEQALRVLQSIGESDAAMTDAYRTMREIRKGFFEKYRNDWDNPAKWDEWNANQHQVDKLFREAFKAKHDAEVKMGAALGEIYEGMYGPAAGEAARAWWDDVVEFNTEIVKREQDFRGEMAQARAAGVPGDLIAAAKQKYYSETKIGLIAELERINGEGIARLERVIKRGPGDGGVPTPEPTRPPGGLNPEAIEMLRKLDEGDAMPAFVTNNLKKIATDNGVNVTPDMNAQSIVDALRAREASSPAPDGGDVATAGPDTPPAPDVDEVNALMAAAEQRKATETAAVRDQVRAVWDVAEEYWGNWANYNRETFGDKHHLLNTLRKAEYGGIPDLAKLEDPRLTPERVRSIMEARKEIKTAAGNEAAENVFKVTEPTKRRKFDVTQINDDTTILRAIALHGGLDLKLRVELTGEKNPKGVPGMFTKKGFGIDEMARMLADDGYPIDMNHPDDPGGVGQATELIRRARSGNPVYPKGHDFNADIVKAEKAFYDAFESADEVYPFEPTLWQTDFTGAVESADLGRVYELIGAFPDELLDNALSPTETWRQYLDRVSDETARRVESGLREEAVAEAAARAEAAIAEAEAHAETVTARNLLKEKFAETFKLDEAQATAWMEMSDSLAEWFAKMTGTDIETFYRRYYGDVVKVEDGAKTVDGGDALYQGAETRIWYSKLTQAVESIPQDVMTVEQMQGAIKKAGVKADELYWTGFDEWMIGRKGKVNKAEALAFLREGGVKLEEVMKGKGSQDSINELHWRLDDLERERQSYPSILHERTPEQKARIEAIDNESFQIHFDINRFEKLDGGRYSQYTLPGGENYRELLITLPEQKELSGQFHVEQIRDGEYQVSRDGRFMGNPVSADSFQDALRIAKERYLRENPTFISSHWNEPNVLAHTRFNDRVDAEGKRVLFIEEIQSDWHQAGREKGYRSEEAVAAFEAARQRLDAEMENNNRANRRLGETGIDWHYSASGNWIDYFRDGKRIAAGEYVGGQIKINEWQPLGSKDVELITESLEIKNRYEAAHNAVLEAEKVQAKAPNAPFAKTWHELVMKRMLRYAAENGYDRVAWTTGEMQAARYDLSKVVERVQYNPKNQLLYAIDKDGGMPLREHVAPNEIDKYIGKDPAKKLLESTLNEDGEHRIQGQDLAVGGEGMRAFYDQILPATMDKYVKKWGAKTGKTQVQSSPKAGESGQGFRVWEGDVLRANVPTREAAMRYMTDGRRLEEAPVRAVHSIDITPAMVESVMQGQPLFQEGPKGGVVFDGEGIKATIAAFERADFTTLVHENAHIYRRVLKDVADKTGNPFILKDLETIEKWAGAKDGQWSRAAEEKFARGFERYLADGKAPTPALVRAFENFRQWMLAIYKTITGSGIDVKLTDEVRGVFDRMLGADGRGVTGMDGSLLRVNERVYYSSGQWILTDILDDGRVHLVNDNGDTATTQANKLQAIKRVEFDVDLEAGKRAAMETTAALGDAFAEKLKQVQEAKQARQDAPARLYSVGDMVSLRDGSQATVTEVHADASMKLDNGRVVSPFEVERVASQDNMFGDLGMKAGPDAQQTTLFQMADQPFGAYDDASQFHPRSEVMDEGWRQNVMPLLKAMEDGAVSGVQDQVKLDGAARDVSPEGQAMLRQYMKEVQNDMATSKLATVRWGEKQRDFALLNYSKRYGVDRLADAGYPYQFYYSRSLFPWAARALDKPALFANYARLKRQQSRYERDIPERLRGKIKIDAPWLPEWMGGSMYVDPLGQLFFPAQALRPFERMMQDKNYQVIEAERILQEWAQDGTYSEAEVVQAASEQGGAVWERAFAEAQMRRESEISNPMDFFSVMFGPAWYLSTPLNLAGIKVPGLSKGDPNKVSTVPLGNTARALETVTKGTWAEPIGSLVGLIGKAEDWGRKKVGLPERGEYGEYYTKRQLANMVADGLISPEDAQLAMIEKSGPLWEQAQERVAMELALRVPTAGAVYAALHEGPVAGAQAFLPSLFGSGILPAGELEYRGLKQEWNEAWKRADAGDTTAVPAFFEEYPEYQAYLAKGKDDAALLRSFLVGQIWDRYMELGETNKKQARAEMGELFQQSFLNKETRSYETLDVNTLTEWARMLGGMIPTPPPTQATLPSPAPTIGDGGKSLRLYPEDVVKVTDQFYSQRTKDFPNWFELQQGYYALASKADRRTYLLKNPQLKEFWDWRRNWYNAYPEYVPIFNGTAFKRVDTSNWPPSLEDFVRMYALTGQPLPQGANAALRNVWMMEGMPMGDYQKWVESQVLPGMMYGE